jgi:putative sterol carrier protein
MAGTYPSQEWLQSVYEKLNSDEHYAQAAQTWEGSMNFTVQPSGALTQPVTFYFDLWHGKCREALLLTDGAVLKEATFSLVGSYENTVRLLRGELDPIQAMLTRKLVVKGNMAYMLRNVPTVMNFVRCLREVTDEVL